MRMCPIANLQTAGSQVRIGFKACSLGPTCRSFPYCHMSSISVAEAKAGFAGLVDETAKGEFVTITRHGKPAAVIVSVEAAEVAKKKP